MESFFQSSAFIFWSIVLVGLLFVIFAIIAALREKSYDGPKEMYVAGLCLGIFIFLTIGFALIIFAQI